MKRQNVSRRMGRLRNAVPNRALACVVALVAGWTGGIAQASQPSGAEVCDRVARLAAHEVGVPVNVMLAITRTETGRTTDGVLAPWPWTVNMEGKGVWFDTRLEAQAYALDHFKEGARSFDVGCFQLNYRWHGMHFRDIAHMFEPIENARYAAEFLSELYAESGSWDSAAAAYHSRTPEFAEKYKTRFQRIIAGLAKGVGVPVVTAAAAAVDIAPRENSFPLLQRGSQTAVMGSLMPLGNNSARSLFPNGG